MTKNNGGKMFFAGMLGAIAGVVGGLLFAPESGQKTRGKIVKLTSEIRAKIKSSTEDSKERVIEVFGEAGEKSMAKYKKIKGVVADKIATIKSAGEEIDREKYVSLVEDVVAEFKGDFDKTKNSAEKMGKLLKSDWEKIKKAIA